MQSPCKQNARIDWNRDSVLISHKMMTGFRDERLVFVDPETGGREPWRPIFELAAVAVDANLNELETFDVRLKFSRHMADPKVLVGSRYETASWRRRAICSDDAAEEFAEFLSRHGTVDQSASNGRVFQVAQMVAHHAAFDSEFLSQWFNRLGRFRQHREECCVRCRETSGFS